MRFFHPRSLSVDCCSVDPTMSVKSTVESSVSRVRLYLVLRDLDFLVVLRVVVFRAGVRLRVAAAFLAVRFLVADAFFPAATRLGDLRVVFRAGVRLRLTWREGVS
jgi:hypothetical protein